MSLFTKALIPLKALIGPILRTPLSRPRPPEGPPSRTSTLELERHHMNLGDTDVQSRTPSTYGRPALLSRGWRARRPLSLPGLQLLLHRARLRAASSPHKVV